MVFKRVVIILMVIVVCLLAVDVFLRKVYYPTSPVEFGVTFSQKEANYLKLDWKKAFLNILDLGVKKIRIPTYWDLGFEDVDYMLDLANKKGAEVLLVLGERQFRWPECHIPVWARNLSPSDRRLRLLDFIKQVVERYKDNQAVVLYQIENEPFLTSYGKGCDPYDEKVLKEEVDLVKSISHKQVVITDSGELGNWLSSFKLADIFGTTVYRDVYDPIWGYLTYPLPTYFYNLKSSAVKAILGQDKKMIVSELQVEPWLSSNDPLNTPIDQQIKLFPLKKLQDHVSYAQKVGFDIAYFWGAEWWYWMAQNGHPEYLEYAKSLF